MGSMIVGGKVYVVGDNIDTDQIIPAQYLSLVPTIREEYLRLGGYALSGLPVDRYPERLTEPGRAPAPYRVIVAGRNFGCGSSREHAPIAIKGAGVACVIAKTFARIFFRNCINTGLPILACPGAADEIDAGDEIEIDLAAGRIRNVTQGREHDTPPFPKEMQDIIAAGGLMNFVKASRVS